MVSVALFQPDIPQNTGAIMRLCACFDVDLHLIEPMGFVLSEPKLKRSGMDYIDYLTLHRHASWEHFKDVSAQKRVILLTTKAKTSFWDFEFQDDDILLFGSESAGVADYVHEQAQHAVIIPMRPEVRSLNLACSASIVLAEAIRQTTEK